MCRQEGHQVPKHSGQALEEAVSVGTGGHSLQPENTGTFPHSGSRVCLHMCLLVCVCVRVCLCVCICVLLVMSVRLCVCLCVRLRLCLVCVHVL